MAKRTSKNETPDQKLSRWLKGTTRIAWEQRNEIADSWSDGVYGCFIIGEVNYGRYDLPTGGYVVIEWDDDGNVSILDRI